MSMVFPCSFFHYVNVEIQMDTKQRRQPRAFSGNRATGLRELYSATAGGVGIISIHAIQNENKRYNTMANVLARAGSGIKTVDKVDSVFYNRQTLKDVFTNAGIKTPEGFKISVKDEFEHPISEQDVLKILNGQYRCDFTEDDINVTYINGNYYSIEALEQSFGYIGKSTLGIGIERDVPLVPTENALFESEQSTLSSLIQINGREYAVTSPNLYAQEKVIFHEFTKNDQSKLAYFLNLNEISLNALMPVDISSRPAGSNLNETVRPSNGEFILSPFVPALVDKPIEAQDVGVELRFTSWLTSLEMIDSVFEIKVNGVVTTLTHINANSTDLTIDTANDVLIVSNNTYAPVAIQLRAKTISLAALEDPRFTFIRTEDQPELVDGYEVYGYTLAAKQKPLELLRVTPHVPNTSNYAVLLARLGAVIGEEPEVVEEGQEIVEIKTLNQDHDPQWMYEETITVSGLDKVVNASLIKNGVKFLDAFAIDQEQWEILQKVDLNQTTLTITRTNQNKIESTQGYSVNQLLARGIWDDTLGLFIFAFECKDDWEGSTKVVYNGNTLFLNTIVELKTTRDLTKTYLPKFSIVDQEQWEILKQAKPEWVTKFGQNAFKGSPVLVSQDGFSLTYDITPTPEEVDLGYVEAEFLVALAFSAQIKPILDRAIEKVETNQLTTPLIRIVASGPYLSGDAYSLTHGQYISKGFNDYYHDINSGDYIIVTRYKTRINLEPNFDLSNPTTAIDRIDNVGTFEVTFDADGVYGSVFKDNVVRQHNVFNSLSFNTPALPSPHLIIADPSLVDNAAVVNKLNSILPAGYTLANTTALSLITQATDNDLSVNVGRDLTGTSTYHAYVVLAELVATPEQIVRLHHAKNKVVVNGMVLNADAFINSLLLINGVYYYLLPIEIINSKQVDLNIIIDLDGDGGIYLSGNTSITINMQVIEPPLSVFMLVDQDADDQSQQALLTHSIASGYPTVVVPNDSPFDCYKTPQMAINGLTFNTDENHEVTIDGSINGIDENTLVAVEFMLYITKAELDARADNTDVIGKITKANTNHSLDITNALIKRQSYIKNGNLYFYSLIKLGEAGGFNGEYNITIDWDGLDSDDSYIIDGVDHNSFYKQSLDFILDVNAVFLPRDLVSPKFTWVTGAKQQELYTDLATGLLPIPNILQNDLIEVDYVSFTKVGGVASTTVIIPFESAGKKTVWFAQTDLDDATYAVFNQAKVMWNDTLVNGGATYQTDAVYLKSQLFKRDGVYYLPILLDLVDNVSDITIDIDLDAGGKKYKSTSSTLKRVVTTTAQKQSPIFGWANNQEELFTAFKAGQLVFPNVTPNEVVDSAYVTYTSVTSIDLSANVISRDNSMMVGFLQFLGSEEIYAILSNDTTFKRSIDGVESTLTWNQLKPELVKYQNKYYLLMKHAIDKTQSQAEISFDVDGAGVKFTPSSTTLVASVTWITQKQSPNFIIAPNQKELLVQARLGLNPRLVGNPEDLADPNGVTYELTDTTFKATYLAEEEGAVPVFVKLNVSESEFAKLGDQIKFGRITEEDPDSFMDLGWEELNDYMLFTYNGEKYLILHSGIVSGSMVDGFLLDADGDKLEYLPSKSYLQASVEFVESIASPRMYFQGDQLAMMESLDSTWVKGNEVKVVEQGGSMIYLDVTTQNQIKALRVSYLTDFTDELFDAINSTTTLVIRNELTNEENTYTGTAIKTMFTKGDDGYRGNLDLNKLDHHLKVSFILDIDGTGRVYKTTTSTLEVITTWIDPIMSPTIKLATNQEELYGKYLAGDLSISPNEIPAKMVPLTDIQYITTTATEFAANVINTSQLDEEFLLFTEFNITEEQLAALNEDGQFYNGLDENLKAYVDKSMFEYNGKYYFSELLSAEYSLNITNRVYKVDLDGNNPLYIQSSASHTIVINAIAQKQSPAVTYALNQNDIRDRIISGEITLPTGPVNNFLPSENIEYLQLDETTLQAVYIPKVSESNGQSQMFVYFVKLGLTQEQYNNLDDKTTFSLSSATSEDETTIMGGELKQFLIVDNSNYYLSAYMSTEMIDVLTMVLDIDGPANEYLPTKALLQLDVREKIVISCDDAPRQTQYVAIDGKFVVNVDGVEVSPDVNTGQPQTMSLIETANAMTVEEMIQYFNIDHPEHGIVVEPYLDISCEGSPNESQCLKLTGLWDVFIDEVKVLSGVEGSELPTELNNLNGSVVLKPCEEIPPEPVIEPNAFLGQVNLKQGRYAEVLVDGKSIRTDIRNFAVLQIALESQGILFTEISDMPA